VRLTVPILLLLLAGAAAPGAQRNAAAPPVEDVVARVGERVGQWYARAQSLVSTETVSIQPLRADFSSQEFPRRLSYELRVAWDAPADGGELPEASVVRQILTINGRVPKPKDEPGCMDPKPVTPEPLGMLLPAQRKDFAFNAAGTTRVDGRAALIIDYRSVKVGTPELTWTDDCVSVDLPGRSRGRIWVDAETHDVLRLDEHLVGMFDFPVPRDHQRRGAPRDMTIERADSSIVYRRVSFTDPVETLMLPAVVETVTVIRGGSTQRYRITQRFSGYKRFLTGGRIVE
jgi:hypothetical protein